MDIIITPERLCNMLAVNDQRVCVEAAARLWNHWCVSLVTLSPQYNYGERSQGRRRLQIQLQLWFSLSVPALCYSPTARAETSEEGKAAMFARSPHGHKLSLMVVVWLTCWCCVSVLFVIRSWPQALWNLSDTSSLLCKDFMEKTGRLLNSHSVREWTLSDSTVRGTHSFRPINENWVTEITKSLHSMVRTSWQFHWISDVYVPR